MIIIKDKVEKNIVFSALIGEDNILPELNKQMRLDKKYFDSLKSDVMHKKGKIIMILQKMQ